MPVGEGDVVGLQDLLGCFGGGGDHGGDLPHRQVHERAVLHGQLSETAVGERGKQMVQASDDGYLPLTWWKLGGCFSSALLVGYQYEDEEDESEAEGEGSKGRDIHGEKSNVWAWRSSRPQQVTGVYISNT